MRWALVLLLLSCGIWSRPRADGGTEYRLEDAGWVGAGDSCSCNTQLSAVVYSPEDEGHHPLLECELNPAFQCDWRTHTYADGGMCEVVACFGADCCLWQCPQRGCR